MESGRGRSGDERRAAAEARARARSGEPRTGDDDLTAHGGEPGRAPDDVIRRAGGRLEGPSDVYARRRLLAFGAAAIVLFILFLLLVGC
jgi:hypothetical protein